MYSNTRKIFQIFLLITTVLFVCACSNESPKLQEPVTKVVINPFVTELNAPIDYASVTADHVTEYGDLTLKQAEDQLLVIKAIDEPSFENVVVPLDQISGEINKAMSNSWMLYWVSPDDAIRKAGIAAYQKMNTYSLGVFADKDLYDQLQVVVKNSQLPPIESKLLTDMILSMEKNGVGLSAEDKTKFQALSTEITELTSKYSTNMNTHNLELELTKEEAEGIPESLTSRYESESSTYKIPIISANRGPVVNNALSEKTRETFTRMYAMRAADTNLEILDQLVAKRHELAQILGYKSFADYNLTDRMAKSPDTVWEFLDGLTQATATKAETDLERMKLFRQSVNGTSIDEQMKPWNFGYLHNKLLKTEYGVDPEEVRKYLPLDKVLTGMMEIYQQLLGMQFKRVENPSVWHESVEMYEVYEGENLVGRFYLDLFPRPNKESHAYAVGLTYGNQKADGYEIPVTMLLGNFTPGSDDLPSLVSHAELRTVFHEFGHVANAVSFKGKYASQNGSVRDFGEAMSQIFENWIWNYDILKTFAKHYETGEVLPEETLKSMLDAKNLISGISAQRGVSSSMYDMVLYSRYDPENPVSTDQIWHDLSEKFIYSSYIEGTHPQAAWIHINTHPTYFYGYLWSRVYAQDMYTRFEKNGLLDIETGVGYRQTILANGTQRPILDVVKEFLGREPSNDAYIRSLGLEKD